ncbi:MAG: hypothetical protein Q9207_003510 [Kuettlingeria erythrocarpa]
MTNASDKTDFEERRRVLETTGGENVLKREDRFLADLFPLLGIYYCSSDDYKFYHPEAWYTFAYGVIDDAAIFVGQQEHHHPNFIRAQLPTETSAAEMYLFAESDKLDSLKTALMLERLFRHRQVDVGPHLRSLKALSTAARLYFGFSHASVDVRVLQQNLHDVHWVRTCFGQRNLAVDAQLRTPEALQPYIPSDRQAFACLAMFELGLYDIDSNNLRDVIAMCSGHSIFFRAALLADPSEPIPSGVIQDLLGNISRSGIAFLVPPEKPLCQEKSLDDWPHIEHNEFDGSVQDNFEATSLHLSFTEAETPLGVNILGNRDQEVVILETLFSVYDGGKWIADLNFSHLFDARSSSAAQKARIPACTFPYHAETPDWRPRMICVDSWLGLINAPEERVSLLRAHRNWQVRLDASSISLALGPDTVILPNEVCWHCAQYLVNGRFRNVILIG